MKKGFTLIELLAVIVILAIIALIATPIVLNIISDSKDSSRLRGAEFYLDAVENSVGKVMLNGNKVQEGIYTIVEDGNLCLKINADKTCKEGFLEVEVSGDIPDKGRVTIKRGNISFAKMNYDDKNIIKEKEEVKYSNKICTLLSGEKNEIGSKYQCKVKETMEEEYKNGYIFYVVSYNTIDGKRTKIKEEAVSTNLILERNICKDGTLTNKDKTDKCTYEYISDEDYGCDVAGCAQATEGPVTAMKILDKATENWKEELRLDDSFIYSIVGPKYFILKGKARMPFNDEINHANNKNTYLYEYLREPGTSWFASEESKPKEQIQGITGYWLNERTADMLDQAWIVAYHGSTTGVKANNKTSIGIRPIIRVEL